MHRRVRIGGRRSVHAVRQRREQREAVREAGQRSAEQRMPEPAGQPHGQVIVHDTCGGKGEDNTESVYVMMGCNCGGDNKLSAHGAAFRICIRLPHLWAGNL